MTQFFSVLFTFIFLSLNIKYVQGKSYCKNEFNSYEVGISQNFIGNKIIHYTIHKDWIRYYFNEYGVFCNKSISKSFNLRFGIDITDLSFSIGTKLRYSPYIGISKMLFKRNRLSIDTRLDLGFTNINVIYLSYGFAPNDLYPRIYSILGISFRFKLSEHFYLLSETDLSGLAIQNKDWNSYLKNNYNSSNKWRFFYERNPHRDISFSLIYKL